jgi:hypothetical protein
VPQGSKFSDFAGFFNLELLVAPKRPEVSKTDPLQPFNSSTLQRRRQALMAQTALNAQLEQCVQSTRHLAEAKTTMKTEWCKVRTHPFLEVHRQHPKARRTTATISNE